MKTKLRKIAAITTFPMCILATAELLAEAAGDSQKPVGTQEMDAVNGGQESSASSQGEALLNRQDVRDAWMLGKIETAFTLNRHLNPFAIKTEVKDGAATLSGRVESDIDRELAGEIAQSIEGITVVQNNLSVAPDSRRKPDADPTWWQQVSDLTTTAVVKAKLLANSSTKGLDIRVSTRSDVVVLEGDVSSSQEKQLAELIAGNTDGVTDVENRLRVSSS